MVLLNFWVFTCYNCTNTVPSLVDFDRKYRDLGLTLIGIHTPEFPPYAGEHDRGNVERALQEYGIDVPQRPGQRLADLEPVRHPVLAQLRADRQAGFHPVRGIRGVPPERRELRTWDSRIQELLAE